MGPDCRCRGIVNEGFEELALALGGITASHDLPDEAVWDLARVVDLTCERIQARLARTEEIAGPDIPPITEGTHPAVSLLLSRLRANGARKGGCHG